ncbi:hypothetical protein GBA65_03735 [Rubrobacter marinus]|uniref:Uncharacterized protein n=1 Tax=Rubrobacter marinus TaxID=2653852 RepID=A0A6G8PUG5_9ACTN|nr:hypothetical protein [Rubrobacter marinus]QIN77772.1 hypothetical protein GBA65_03735 [Rubrobacter marinus]
MERGRDASEQGAEGRSDEYTVVGIVDDGTPLNRVVKEIRELGVGKDDLTVIVKRPHTDEPEPFPEGTRYIVVPDDRRGLEVPVGFAIAFILLGIFFAAVVPSIGVPTFLVFISLAAVLIAGSFTRVGAQPILTDMGAPREDSGAWNDQFEIGKVLIFAVTRERRLIRPLRQAIQASGGAYFIVDRRLEPRAVAQASIHRAGQGERQSIARPTEA